ncbi:ankyrin repeat-containing domain protein [Chaetomidium leptoderma]|uniref:Ankyrin repeat-containing domain protein n=1 Tax=Chaetomidium leptoderma TaxID=669021 RepID=A0AAN6VPW9_9PEZI|nr:ankyrin repeat-containing domain protein [Chaetomidium leptoderma]
MASSSHLLTALPIELLVFVIENLNRVEDIAALALTNRRLYSTTNPHLYKRAARCQDARALAWAANRGLVSTLRMALAAGIDPNHEFIESLSADEWERVSAAARADAAAGRPKQLWAMWDYNNRPRAEIKWPCRPETGTTGSTPTSTCTIVAPSPHGGPSCSDQDSVVSSEEDLSRRSDATPATEPSPAPTTPGVTLTRRFTAVHLAARGGHNEILEMLIRHGAFVNAASQCFCACTQFYGRLNHLEHPEEDADQPLMAPPLHAAICHSQTETAKLLLSHKASPIMETTSSRSGGAASYSVDLSYGSTALHLAAAMGMADLVRHIVENKIQTDVNVQDQNTLTPFYYAYARRRWDSTVPLLLELGADMHCEAKMYIPYTAITPLGEACRLGDFAVADRLIDLGADVMNGFVAPTAGGCLTPLHMCCMRSAQPAKGGREPKEQGAGDDDDDEARGRARMRTIEKLIAHGASLDVLDCFGSTPLMAAVQSCNTFALEALSIAGVAPAPGASGGGAAAGREDASKSRIAGVCTSGGVATASRS